MGCGGVVAIDTLAPAEGAAREDHEAARLRLLDDYQPWLGPFTMKLRRGAAQVQVPAEFGWCYAYFATGGEGVQDLDMVATRPNGREAGRDSMFDTTPYVQHCSDHDEMITVEVLVARGSGDATFAVLRKPD